MEIDRFRERFIKYTRLAFQLLPKIENPHILDIGCGSGIPTIVLAKLSEGKITGIDIDQRLLDRFEKRIEEEGLQTKWSQRNVLYLILIFLTRLSILFGLRAQYG